MAIFDRVTIIEREIPEARIDPIFPASSGAACRSWTQPVTS
jgi:hypothetical protein